MLDRERHELVKDRVDLLAFDDTCRERAKDRSANAVLIRPLRDARNEIDRLDTELRRFHRLVARQPFREGLTEEDLGPLRLRDRCEEIAVASKAEECLLLASGCRRKA